jgi:hypothetical protein
VLRKQKDAVMVLFSTADAAAAAAARMQGYITSDRTKCEDIQVRIGFACGEVRQVHRDVLGDTVSLALEFSRHAKNGQIVTSQATASSLSPALLTALRPLPASPSDVELGLKEVRWQEAAAQILSAHKEASSNARHTTLRLEYSGKVILRRREFEYITFGRDPKSDLVIALKIASKCHCTVTRLATGFALRDHSTNGTFVMSAGEGEIHVHSDQCVLGKNGWIALGESADTNTEIIRYHQI